MNPIILKFLFEGNFKEKYYCEACILMGHIVSISIRPMQGFRKIEYGPLIDKDVFADVYSIAYNHEQLRGFYGKTSKINDF